MNLFHSFPKSTALLVGAVLMAGCNSMPSHHQGAGLSLKADQNDIYVGERVTLMTQTENTLGQNANLDWSSTGGSINKLENGRIAQIQFDNPGTFHVTATMKVNDKIVDTESSDIVVRPLPNPTLTP